MFIVAVMLLGISESVGIMITILLLYTLPAIIVHIQYYFLNRGSAFLVKNERIFIESKHGYDMKEIEGIIRIDLYAAGGVFKKIEWDAYPVQQYHYIKISTDSEVYYVTSILFDVTIEKRLKRFIDYHDAVYHRHKKIIPFISLS
ncbi:hypothetical protein [Hymenobacter sp. 102]|uniref:hypothetical protein n=1 Tax=Hymenobacter sp. 102 TaxID=3403152 RepID=UPI003CEEF56E